MSKVKTDKLVYKNEKELLHDIDLAAFGQMDYNLDGGFPIANGELLNNIFPKGATPDGFKNVGGNGKKWYFIYNIVNQAIEVIEEQWDYQGLPDELDKYRIENKLIKNGSGYMVKINNTFVFVNGTVKETNIYDEATEIEVNETNWNFDNTRFKDGDFIEFTSELSKQGIYNLLIQTVNSYIDCLQAMARDLSIMQHFGIVLNSSKDNTQMMTLLNAMKNKENVWLSYNLDANDEDLIKKLTNVNRDNPLILETSLKSETENIIKQTNFWDNQFNKIVGIPLSALEKAERVIQAEVQSQQGVSEFIREHRLNKRKLAIEKCNKKWGTNWSVDYNIINQPLMNDNNKGDEPDENE